MKVTEKDREAVREILERLGVLGTASESEELFAVERVAAAYRRGLEDAANHLREVARLIGSDGDLDPPGVAAIRHAQVAVIEACEQTIRKLGEDA